MASIDIDSLRTPIDSDRPAGEDLEYDPLFSEMEQAAVGKPQQQMGDAVIEAEPPDWRLVQKNAIKLLQRSKDLRVCVYLCQSALHNEGIEGLSEALRLTSLLTEDLWDSVYPELDADDDNDPTARVNTVMALTSSATLLYALEHAPLLSIPMLGSVSWAQVKPLAADDQPRPASAEVDAIINNCEPEQIAARRAAVKVSLEACQSLETFVTAQVGASRAPNLEPLRDMLKRIDNQLKFWWEQRGGDQAEPEEELTEKIDDQAPAPFERSGSTEHAGSVATAQPHDTARAGGPIGAITSRQEAIAAIDKILEYYRRHEPSSPLPLLLARAKRLATKSFIEILQDLIPEGLGRAHEIGGLTNSSDSASSGAAPASTTRSSSESETKAASPSTASDDADDDFFS